MTDHNAETINRLIVERFRAAVVVTIMPNGAVAYEAQRRNGTRTVGILSDGVERTDMQVVETLADIFGLKEVE